MSYRNKFYAGTFGIGMRTTFLKYTGILILGLLLVQCNRGPKKKQGFKYHRTKTEKVTNKKQVEVPVDLNNKGIGPVKNISFSATVNKDLANTGKALFMEKCTICHLPEKKLIGPAMTGIYERRSPEWVMNMILNPLEMLKKDTIAKALQQEYSGAIMIKQNITEEEARAIAEYLRTL